MTRVLAHHLATFLGIILVLLISSTSSSSSSPAASNARPTTKYSIEWEVQFNTTEALFQSIGMCKGTTDKTRKVGFVGGVLGSIWRTLDGVNWQQVALFPESAFWYGMYCFPDAQRVIAVGFSDGDAVMANGAIITWSFDGGNTWTDRMPMPKSGGSTWLQSVQFHNDTHGIIVPSTQDKFYLTYYTTNGGKNASDWKVAQPGGHPDWWQSHAIWMFGDVTRTFAQDFSGPQVCSSENFGASWNCDAIPQAVTVGSYTTSNDSIGVDNSLNIYSTRDGGSNWSQIASLPFELAQEMVTPSDMVWIPNTDVVILVGGNAYTAPVGTVAHSMDGGVTWVESIPQLPPTAFYSIDSVTISPTTTEVWTVAANIESTTILHATITMG